MNSKDEKLNSKKDVSISTLKNSGVGRAHQELRKLFAYQRKMEKQNNDLAKKFYLHITKQLENVHN